MDLRTSVPVRSGEHAGQTPTVPTRTSADVTVGSGQAVENALVSPVLGDGAYGDNMCDGWRITTTGRRQVTISYQFLPSPDGSVFTSVA